MANPRTCPKCGAVHTADAMDGLCPRCVLAVVMEPPGQATRFPPGAGPPVSRAGWFFGNYELLEEIGRGGMGVIYKARQAGLDRLVAVKMILGGHFASRESVQRFQAEAQTAAKLQHPNIVALHEVGEHEGQHFFSMDFVEGRSLAELVREQPLSPARAARYVQRLAEAIHFAHTRGILHRDLKPSNILIDADDQPRITDFGLAKQLQGDGGITLTGQVLGSPNYMPPEQATGKGAAIGPWSDVYSLGAILYQLLTGRGPFVADTVEQTLQQVLHNEPVAPRTLIPGVPRDLETICLKCLEKEPPRRYGTAQELADELGCFREGKPIRARAMGPFGKSWRWARRNPVVTGLGCLAVVLFMAGLSGILAQWRRAEGHANREVAQRQRAEQTLRQLELQHAEELLEQDQAADALAYLARALKKNPANEAAAHRIVSALSQRSFALPVTPTMRHEAAVNAVEFSPDGNRLATASADNTARIWDATTGHPITGPLRHSNEVTCVRFSPDGKRLITASADKTARVWDALTGEPLTHPLAHEDQVVVAEFSPDGLKIVTGSLDKTARIWSATDGRRLGEPIPHGDRIVSAHFSSDGATVLSASFTDGLVQLSHADSSRLLHKFLVGGWVESARLSPDGQRVIVASYQQFARLLEAGSGKEIATLRHHDVINDAVFSPDGELVATVSRDRRALLWDARTGELVMELPRHLTWIESVAFSRDGLRLLTRENSDHVWVWDILTGEKITEPLQSGGLLRDARFSPDGKKLVVAAADGTVHVRNISSGKAQPLWLDPTSDSHQCEFSHDGEQLVTGSQDGAVTVWNARQCVLLRTFKHDSIVTSVQFSPDGKKVLSGSTDNTACLWDLETGEKISVRHQARVIHAGFSPDGKWFVTASFDGTARTWVTRTGEPLAPKPMRHEARLWYAEFSPDGRTIATASGDGSAQIWDAQTGKPLTPPFQHRQALERISFSPDGKKLLTASSDHTAGIWAVATGERLAQLGHNGPVYHAIYNPDGQRVVTASADNTARIWDAVTGQPVTEPLRHKAEVRYAEFSPDGRWVATASLDGTARIWDAQSGKPLTEPFAHGFETTRAVFSPDGRRLLTAPQVRLWDIPLLTAPAPRWLADLAESVAGQRFDESGHLQPVAAENLLALREGQTTAGDPDSSHQWLTWFFADRTARAISPSQSITAPAMAERVARKDSLEGLLERIRLAPTNGLAYARLARRLLEQQLYEEPFKFARAEVWGRRAVALNPELAEAWLAYADILKARDKPEQALAALNSGIERHPDDARLWHRQGRWLAEKGSLAAAVEAFKKALSLTNGWQHQRVLAELKKALFELKSPVGAAQEWASISKIPLRHPQTPAACLDLSPFYNAALSEDWHGELWPGNNLATLPVGCQRLGGVDFDVRGIIQLAGTALKRARPEYPERINSIPLDRFCQRLHFLHAAAWGDFVPAGTKIGGYRLRYANGEEAEISLHTGEDLAEWEAGRSGSADLKRATVAWAGRNTRKASVRLYKRTWENPQPGVKIIGLDFVSAMTDAAPFLIAVSVEP
jgi:WD40 repeat protein/predicted Ser/Thr protein kinase